MNTGLAISIAALGLSLVGVIIAVMNQAAARRKRRDEQARKNFIEAREYLKINRGALAEAAIDAQSEFQWDAHVPLLTRPGWIPSQPLSLDEVSVQLREPSQEEVAALVQGRSRLLDYWPQGCDGRRLSRYSQAIIEYDKSARMEDRPSYRLIGVHVGSISSPRYELTLTEASYFDGVDTGESLAHETAFRKFSEHEAPAGGPYRSWLADPFRLGIRAAMPGINTLTIRLSKGQPSIYMHKRGFNAGVSMGVLHVAPAGEFQPQTADPTIWASDLSILKNIIREYAEEFLGVDEATGSGGITIDYQKDHPYSEFFRAIHSGKMKVFYLGMGLDPVSWKPEILTACVFEQGTFDRIFRDMVTDKIDEGTGGILLVGKDRSGGRISGRRFGGLPLYAESTKAFSDLKKTLPAGVACLELVRRWESVILPRMK